MLFSSTIFLFAFLVATLFLYYVVFHKTKPRNILLFVVSLIFYAYNCAGSKGIGVWLGNIQKLKDGPRLNARISAEEEFQPVTYDEILSQEAERL